LKELSYRLEKKEDETTQFYLLLPKEHIVYVQAIIESYEGIALVRTIDNDKECLSITTTKSLETTCKELIESLVKELNFT
jgi:Domain of unknown function (DUF4911)